MRVVTMVMVFTACFVAGAQASPADWDTTVAFGATLTSGNSDALLSSLATDSVRKGTPNEIRVSSAVNYGQNNNGGSMETTVQNVNAGADYKRVRDDGMYGRLDVSFLHDDVAEVVYRVVVGPSAGKYLIRNSATSLHVDIGFGLLFEEVGGIEINGVLLTLRGRWEHKLSDTGKLWQSLELLPEIDKLENLLINAELGLEAGLNKRTSLRLVISDKYDSEPAKGIEENDVSMIASVVLKI